MAISDYKSVDAKDRNGNPVRGICRRETGTFEAKKGAVKIAVPEYEYYFVFSVAGKRYRSVFGKESDHGKIGARGTWESSAIEAAVDALLRYRSNAVRGEGPTSRKEEMELARQVAEERKRKERREKTVADLIKLFLEDISIVKPNIKTTKPRTVEEYRLNLCRDVEPAIGKRKAKTVEREDISEIIDKIVKRGRIVQANRTLAACSRLFNWSLAKGYVLYNPCARMAKYAERPRSRVLTEQEQREPSNERAKHAEIKLLWEKLLEVRHQTEARILLLCLLTGCRPGEICSMRWEDIEESGWWSSEETKTGVALEVYLTPTALDLIGKKLDQSHTFVFMMETDEKRHLPEDRLSRYVRERNEYFGLPPWQPRDLRRTYTTLAKGLGFSDLILNKAQTRVDSSVIRTHYDKRRYYDELRQLAEVMERELMRIIGQPVEPAKVINLRN